MKIRGTLGWASGLLVKVLLLAPAFHINVYAEIEGLLPILAFCLQEPGGIHVPTNHMGNSMEVPVVGGIGEHSSMWEVTPISCLYL